MTTTLSTTDTAQLDTIHAWKAADMANRYGALLDGWTTSTAVDGLPLLTATVRGRQASEALRRFAAGYGLLLTAPGDQKPRLEYDDRGITASWRTSNVWVQLTSTGYRYIGQA